MKTIEPCKNSP